MKLPLTRPHGWPALAYPDASTVITTKATPTCPIASTTYICISPNGYVNKVDDGACNDSVGSGTGATLYMQTSDAQTKYKVMIWGLTGLPKLVDTWSR